MDESEQLESPDARVPTDASGDDVAPTDQPFQRAHRIGDVPAVIELEQSCSLRLGEELGSFCARPLHRQAQQGEGEKAGWAADRAHRWMTILTEDARLRRRARA